MKPMDETLLQFSTKALKLAYSNAQVQNFAGKGRGEGRGKGGRERGRREQNHGSATA